MDATPARVATIPPDALAAQGGAIPMVKVGRFDSPAPGRTAQTALAEAGVAGACFSLRMKNRLRA